MAIKIKDGDGAEKYLKATGTGADASNGYVTEHTIASGATISLAAGTAEIGKLAAGTAVIGSLAAGSAAIGTVTLGPQTAAAASTSAANALTGNTVQLATDSLRNGSTAVTPVFAVINVASTGSAQEIVAAAGTSNKIRVLALNIVVGDAVNVYVASATTPITGQWEFNGKGDGIVLPFSPVGWFETAADVALNLFLSAGVSVDGSVTYVVVQ